MLQTHQSRSLHHCAVLGISFAPIWNKSLTLWFLQTWFKFNHQIDLTHSILNCNLSTCTIAMRFVQFSDLFCSIFGYFRFLITWYKFDHQFLLASIQSTRNIIHVLWMNRICNKITQFRANTQDQWIWWDWSHLFIDLTTHLFSCCQYYCYCAFYQP